MDYEKSTNFDEQSYKSAGRAKKEPRGERPNIGFREKLAFWREQAIEMPDGYYIDYNPNDYSVDEWETYLIKKNNDLNFEQFVRRPRWRISPYDSHTRATSLDEYMGMFNSAGDNCNSFLSDDEVSYVERLIKEIKRLRREYYDASTAWMSYIENDDMDNPYAKDACGLLIDLMRQLRFTAKWKYIAGGHIPANIKGTIGEAIMKEIDYRKRRWMYSSRYDVRHMYDDAAKTKNPVKWNADKLRLFKAADEYGALTPTQINNVRNPDFFLENPKRI